MGDQLLRALGGDSRGEEGESESRELHLEWGYLGLFLGKGVDVYVVASTGDNNRQTDSDEESEGANYVRMM